MMINAKLPEGASASHTRSMTVDVIEYLGFEPRQVLEVTLRPGEALVSTISFTDDGRIELDRTGEIVRNEFRVDYSSLEEAE